MGALRIAAGFSSLLLAVQLVHGAEAARSADALVDTIGINIHSNFPGVYDQNWNTVVQRFGEIGFRYVRDVPDRPDRLNQLTGVKVVAIAQNGPTDQYALLDSIYPTMLQHLKQLNNLAYIEWPNEPEYMGLPDWPGTLHTWVPRLYADAKADNGLKNKPFVATVTGGASLIADLAIYADYGNEHSYAGGWQPTTYAANWDVYAGAITGNKPRLATEAGYFTLTDWVNRVDFNHGVTEKAAGKYMGRLFFDYFNMGKVVTLPYELLDEPNDPASAESHFGILRSDLSYKPAATVIKNIIALLKDPGSDFTPASLDMTITGGGSTLRHTLLQKRDGTYWLALWQDAVVFDWQTGLDLNVTDLPVTLSLGGNAVVARTFLPGNSDAPTAVYNNASSFNLQVPDQVMLVQLDMTGASVPEPGIAMWVAGGACLLLRRRRR